MKTLELIKKLEGQDSKNYPKIFDIRNKEKYEISHIKGAVSIEKGMLIENPDKFFNKKEKVYVTCNSGNSAGLVAKILQGQGYDIESLEGGMNELLKKSSSEKCSEECSCS